MSKVFIVSEGGTEISVVTRVFSGDFALKGIALIPIPARAWVRGSGQRGGESGSEYRHARKIIVDTLKSDRNCRVTMWFDYYGMERSRTPWPGYQESLALDYDDKPRIIEQRVLEDVSREFGNLDTSRFISYVQKYELEGLLFSDPAAMARVFDRPDLEQEFLSIVSRHAGCENINGGKETNASAQILRLHPGYRKGNSDSAHAHMILAQVGTPKIRERCPRVDGWLGKLEYKAQKMIQV